VTPEDLTAMEATMSEMREIIAALKARGVDTSTDEAMLAELMLLLAQTRSEQSR
jgi:hypothetical protein